MPIKKLPASGGATGGSNLRQNIARDSKVTVEEVQASGYNLAGTPGVIHIASAAAFVPV